MKQDNYKRITDQIVAKLEKGQCAWRQCWRVKKPYSMQSKTEYHGMNLFLVNTSFDDNRWVTFMQAKKLGLHVKKGATGFPVIFWKLLQRKNNKFIEVDVDTDKENNDVFPLLKSSTVFNLQQCDGNKEEIPRPVWQAKFEEAQQLVDNQNIELIEGGIKACFVCQTNKIKIPVKNSFENYDLYYSILFHELIHYAIEQVQGYKEEKNIQDRACHELIAELGASFLCADYNINCINNQTAYIQSWLKALKNDKKYIFKAVSQAKQAIAYLKKSMEKVQKIA